jgi:hypothetical protein
MVNNRGKGGFLAERNSFGEANVVKHVLASLALPASFEFVKRVRTGGAVYSGPRGYFIAAVLIFMNLRNNGSLIGSSIIRFGGAFAQLPDGQKKLSPVAQTGRNRPVKARTHQ